MGKNFDQLVNELRDLGSGASVHVTFVMHQDNQLVSYATGFLNYYRSIAQVTPIGPQDFGEERLASSTDKPLQYLFSDRKGDINPPPPPGSFGHPPRQPFSVDNDKAEKLGMSIGGLPFITTDPATIHFTALSEGNATFTLDFTSQGNLLLSTLGDSAIYTISFDGPFAPVTPPH